MDNTVRAIGLTKIMLTYNSISLKFFIFLGAVCAVYGANLRCYEGSLDNFTEISFDQPEVLLNSSCFDAERNTTIYAFGFRENATDFTVQNIIGTYIDLNYNALLLNWEDEATVPFLGSASYGIVIFKLKRVARKFGQAIVKLYDAGFNLPSLHLLGFSLGAHLMGYAGREVKDNGLLVSRMTLFDPAGPAFDGIFSFSGVGKDCAQFVEVIHGNPGNLGTVDSVGTVDFWPNCGSSIQPGCETKRPGQLPPDGCSHNRAWMYYIESLTRKDAFPASAASSCDTWRDGYGTGQIIYMGDYINMEATGNFYLRTNSEEPFGLGDAGTQPDSFYTTTDIPSTTLEK